MELQVTWLLIELANQEPPPLEYIRFDLLPY